LFLTGQMRAPAQMALPDLLVAPGEVVTFGAGGRPLGAGFSMENLHPELALFDATQRKPYDLFFPGTLQSGAAYGRSPRGAESYSPY
jgi:hypothetical protein